MIIDKNYEGLLDDGWGYRIEDNIETEEFLKINLDAGLYITGSVKVGSFIEANHSIKADGDIKSGGSIEVKGAIRASGSVKADGYIKTGWYIEAGGSIEARGSIIADGFIKADRSIEAGGSIGTSGFIEAEKDIKAGDGIVAGLSVTCKEMLSSGLGLFAGVCSLEKNKDEDKTVTCGKLVSGTIEYGLLVETNLEDGEDDKTEEAMQLLKEKGYKIIKD